MMNKAELTKFLKFLVVGVINTALTYVVYVVMRFFDFTPYVSNLVGYVVGVINSFVWNRQWVFRSSASVFRSFVLFIIVFLVCYGVQLAAFNVMLERMDVNEYLAQFVGMCLYSVLNYLLNRFFTFKK